MTELILRIQEAREKEFQKSLVASAQLGAYEAILKYAISALRGQTACTPEEVANYCERKHTDLLKEQEERLFPSRIC